MSLQSIIQQKERRLERIPGNLISASQRAQQSAFTRALNLIGQIDRNPDGTIRNTVANLDRVNDIVSDMEDQLFGAGYADAVAEFVEEFPREAQLTRDQFRETFGDFDNREFYRRMVRSSQERALADLGADVVAAQFGNAVRGFMDDSVSTRSSWEKMVVGLREIAEGSEEREGVLQRHVKRVARDTFNVSDRNLADQIAEDLNAHYFQYAGGTVGDTREFCTERNGRFFHREEMKAWGRGEATQSLEWPQSGTWQGRTSGTNEGTIFSYMGGYNCMHFPVWVDRRMVPDEVRVYARSQGWPD